MIKLKTRNTNKILKENLQKIPDSEYKLLEEQPPIST